MHRDRLCSVTTARCTTPLSCSPVAGTTHCGNRLCRNSTGYRDLQRFDRGACRQLPASGEAGAPDAGSPGIAPSLQYGNAHGCRQRGRATMAARRNHRPGCSALLPASKSHDLENVRRAADIYLRSGQGEHEHAELVRALERPGKARRAIDPPALTGRRQARVCRFKSVFSPGWHQAASLRQGRPSPNDGTPIKLLTILAPIGSLRIEDSHPQGQYHAISLSALRMPCG